MRFTSRHKHKTQAHPRRLKRHRGRLVLRLTPARRRGVEWRCTVLSWFWAALAGVSDWRYRRSLKDRSDPPIKPQTCPEA